MDFGRSEGRVGLFTNLDVGRGFRGLFLLVAFAVGSRQRQIALDYRALAGQGLEALVRLGHRTSRTRKTEEDRGSVLQITRHVSKGADERSNVG